MRSKGVGRIALEFTVIALSVACLCLSGCSSKYSQAQEKEDRPLTFGVLADIQYGDQDDSHSKAGSRCYRASLGKLTECIEDLNNRDLDFVIQLGDLIDRRREDLQPVLKIYNQAKGPRYHVVGNHCLAAGKETLREELGLERFYYDFTIPSRKAWRFIVLDGNDPGYGNIGHEQLAWLRSTLDQAAKKGEKVICFCHYAVLPSAAVSGDHMEVTEPVLKVIEDSGCVVAWFAGHAHAGGYGLQKGIHHVTFKGMVDGPINAYAIVRVLGDRLEITGFGRESNRVLPLPASRAVQHKGINSIEGEITPTKPTVLSFARSPTT